MALWLTIGMRRFVLTSRARHTQEWLLLSSAIGALECGYALSSAETLRLVRQPSHPCYSNFRRW